MNKIKGRDNKSKNKNDVLLILSLTLLALLFLHLLKKSAITGFIVIPEESTYTDELNLELNESRNITWNINNPGNLKSLSASGAISKDATAKIYLESNDKKLLIFDSTKHLFDVGVEVLPEYKRIYQGNEILIQIGLFNLKGFGKFEVNVKYSIEDKNGNFIATEEEIVTVETQTKFIRKLLVPFDLKPGAYTAFVEVKSKNEVLGTSSDLFEVLEKEEVIPKKHELLLGILIVITILVVIILSLIPIYKKMKKKKEIKEIREKLPEEKITKLENELKALEKAYKSKFISKQSYMKRKSRIVRQLRIIKK